MDIFYGGTPFITKYAKDCWKSNKNKVVGTKDEKSSSVKEGFL